MFSAEFAFNLDTNPSIQFAYLQALFDSEAQKAMLVEQGVAGITNFSQRCIEDLETKGGVLRGVGSSTAISSGSALGELLCYVLFAYFLCMLTYIAFKFIIQCNNWWWFALWLCIYSLAVCCLTVSCVLSAVGCFFSKDENEEATATSSSVFRREVLVEYPFTVSVKCIRRV